MVTGHKIARGISSDNPNRRMKVATKKTLETRVTGPLFEDISNCTHEFPAQDEGTTQCKKCGMVLTATMPGAPEVAGASPRNLWQRLNAIREAVNRLDKDVDVKGADQEVKYSAVGHDQVTQVVRAAMIAHGVMSTVSLEHSESVPQGVKWGAREVIQHHAVYLISFINIDNPDEQVEVRSEAYADDAGDKGPGKAESYAVKYAYMKMFAMVTGEDDEGRIPDEVLSELTVGDIEKLQVAMMAQAEDLFGIDQAEDVLNSLAKRRAHIESGNWLEIPAKQFQLCMKSLREKATELEPGHPDRAPK